MTFDFFSLKKAKKNLKPVISDEIVADVKQKVCGIYRIHGFKLVM